MSVKPFIIFSLARSGSTSLGELTNTRRSNQCVMEPFAPNNFSGQYLSLALNEGLPSALAAIHSKYVGLKHVWHPAGWPFPVRGFNERLLFSSDHNLIFLYRKNILQRVVSGEIADQCKIWHARDPALVRDRETHKYQPLDKVKISRRLEKEGILLEHLIQRLTSEHPSWMPIAFEEMFSTDLAIDQSIRKVASVIAFLGLDEADPKDLRRIIENGRNGVSSTVYSQIPEIDKIEKSFGSDTTGYLFS